MKKLPQTWCIDIQQEHPLIGLFKDWYDQQLNTNHSFCLKYYGFMNEKGDSSPLRPEKVITLEEWNNCVFGKEEIFEKGEEVLVRNNYWTDINEWVSVVFIAEFERKFVVDWDSQLYYFDQCKKKPSELDIKIEELKKFAEEKGVKLTITVE